MWEEGDGESFIKPCYECKGEVKKAKLNWFWLVSRDAPIHIGCFEK